MDADEREGDSVDPAMILDRASEGNAEDGAPEAVVRREKEADRKIEGVQLPERTREQLDDGGCRRDRQEKIGKPPQIERPIGEKGDALAKSHFVKAMRRKKKTHGKLQQVPHLPN